VRPGLLDTAISSNSEMLNHSPFHPLGSGQNLRGRRNHLVRAE